MARLYRNFREEYLQSRSPRPSQGRPRVDPEDLYPEEPRSSQQRNVGIAIAVLALVVVVVLFALVMGGTDAFR